MARRITVEIAGRLYDVRPPEGCSCNRCALHDDPGGCIVGQAIWGLFELLAGRELSTT